MAKKLVKNIASVLFIPVIFAVTKAFYVELSGAKTLTEALKYFLSGVAAYVLVYIIFIRMDRLYTFGHELVHALFVWLFGGRVLSFKAGKTSGSVETTKSNIMIDLTPYFVPIYTVFLFILYLIATAFWKVRLPSGYFIFLLGFSMSFHIVMTIDKMKIEQSDFLRLGYFNSLILIYFVNCIIIASLFAALLPDFSFRAFTRTFALTAKESYVSVFYQLFGA